MFKQLTTACLLLAMIGCGQPSATSEPVSEPAETPQAAPADPPASTERVQATVGVGQKGRSLDNETGIGRVIAEPAKALFGFREKAVFDMQIPTAMKLFAASEGRGPDSHEEFMSKIIQSNSIQLPELPEGHKYVFEPSTGELMVERPAG